MKYDLTISSSPHIRASHSTASLMRDVCIALAPALIFAIWLYGFRVLAVTAVSVAACVFFEWGYRRMMKKDNTVRDCSAVLTGLLLAMVSPPTVPYWVIVLGALFAIVVVKQLYGGIGKNFLNPSITWISSPARCRRTRTQCPDSSESSRHSLPSASEA